MLPKHYHPRDQRGVVYGIARSRSGSKKEDDQTVVSIIDDTTVHPRDVALGTVMTFTARPGAALMGDEVLRHQAKDDNQSLSSREGPDPEECI